MNAAPVISHWQLLISVALVVIAGLVSTLLQLGLLRSLVWGSVRTFVQLTLVAYVLHHVFDIDHPALVVGLVVVMVLIAARAVTQRVKDAPFSTYWISALSLAASTYFVGTLVCALIIAADRWYTAPIAIPIAGLILGNSLNGISLSLDRYLNEVRQHVDEVEQRLCLGYSPWEAVRPHVRTALRAGMTPAINALMVAGIVHLPGIFSGQILAGVDPMTAVRYQIVIMLTVAAAVALGSLMVVGFCYRRCFTDEQALLPTFRSGY